MNRSRRIPGVLILCLIAEIVTGRNAFAYKGDSIQDSRKEVVEIFYEKLLSEKPPSISDYQSLFGNYTLVEEEYKFFEDCESKEKEDCDDLAMEVFRNLSNSQSILFSELRKLRAQLMPLNEDISTVISNAEILETGFPFSVELVLKFSNHYRIYFELNGYEDEPVIIHDIYLTNGASVFNGLGIRDQNKMLKRLAVIDDSDGFTNVRLGQGTETQVIGRITENDLFFYVPSSESNWYKVQFLKTCEWGYMHKSRISYFGTLSDERKESLRDKIHLLMDRMPCYED